MPKVSIIIPTYNCGQYINQAIESALNQTYQDREIIVVDDGSTDNTYAKIKSYQTAGLIIYVFQENEGKPKALNTGILMAEGEFIFVPDADDGFDKQMISKCLEKVERENTDWCVTDILRIENVGGAVKTEIYRSHIPQDNFVSEILADDFIRRAIFFRKKSLLDVGLYDEEILVRVDWTINIRMILGNKPFSYIPEPLYVYKIRNDSLIKTKHRRRYDYTLKVLKKYHKKIADESNKDVAKIYAHKLWRLGEQYMTEVHDIKLFILCLTESMRYDFSIRRLLHPFYHHLIKPLARQGKASKRVKAER